MRTEDIRPFLMFKEGKRKAPELRSEAFLRMPDKFACDREKTASGVEYEAFTSCRGTAIICQETSVHY